MGERRTRDRLRFIRQDVLRIFCMFSLFAVTVWLCKQPVSDVRTFWKWSEKSVFGHPRVRWSKNPSYKSFVWYQSQLIFRIRTCMIPGTQKAQAVLKFSYEFFFRTCPSSFRTDFGLAKWSDQDKSWFFGFSVKNYYSKQLSLSDNSAASQSYARSKSSRWILENFRFQRALPTYFGNL